MYFDLIQKISFAVHNFPSVIIFFLLCLPIVTPFLHSATDNLPSPHPPVLLTTYVTLPMLLTTHIIDWHSTSVWKVFALHTEHWGQCTINAFTKISPLFLFLHRFCEKKYGSNFQSLFLFHADMLVVKKKNILLFTFNPDFWLGKARTRNGIW